MFLTLYTARGAVYCNRSCLCLCLFVCVFVCVCTCVRVCGSVTAITWNCMHRSSPNWVCRWRLWPPQLIKFWPSCTPGKGSAAWRSFLAPPYYSQRAVFASPPSAFFIWLAMAEGDCVGWVTTPAAPGKTPRSQLGDTTLWGGTRSMSGAGCCASVDWRGAGWRFGVAVTRWSRSTQLLYIEPG